MSPLWVSHLLRTSVNHAGTIDLLSLIKRAIRLASYLANLLSNAEMVMARRASISQWLKGLVSMVLSLLASAGIYRFVPFSHPNLTPAPPKLPKAGGSADLPWSPDPVKGE